MKRIIVLAVVALAILVVARIWLACHGDIYRTLGLRCELRWDVAADGSITRSARFTGPTPVGRYVASSLEIDERHGWQQSENPAAQGEGVEFVKCFEPGASDWRPTRLETCSARGGEMHYRETWITGIATHADRDDRASASDLGSPQTAKLREDFNTAIREASRRFGVAIDQFAAGIPTTLTVRMPGPIRSTEGLAIGSATDSASLSGHLGDLSGRRLEIVSLVDRSTSRSRVVLWASLAAFVALACAIAITARRRTIRLCRLRASLVCAAVEKRGAGRSKNVALREA